MSLLPARSHPESSLFLLEFPVQRCRANAQFFRGSGAVTPQGAQRGGNVVAFDFRERANFVAGLNGRRRRAEFRRQIIDADVIGSCEGEGTRR
jgi:hypothetical protein